MSGTWYHRRARIAAEFNSCLGRHAPGLGTTDALAPGAICVDIPRLGPTSNKDDDHEAFGTGTMNGQLYLRQVFHQALIGQPVVLDPASIVESIERQLIYRLRARHERGRPA